MMDWGIIGTAVLAGGIVGQVITLVGTHYFAGKREHRQWRLAQRHKVIVEIIDVLTSNPSVAEMPEWTHKIRRTSLKIHILYKDGTAPAQLRHCLEVVFRLAQMKKDGTQSDTWDSDYREAVSALRKQLSKDIDID